MLNKKTPRANKISWNQSAKKIIQMIWQKILIAGAFVLLIND